MKKIFLILLPVFVLAIACEEKTASQHMEHDDAYAHLKNVKLDSNIDPYCKMKVDKYLVDTASIDGKTYGFCSVLCKEEVLNNPDKYLKK
jgi:YHS domain-containing protein